MPRKKAAAKKTPEQIAPLKPESSKKEDAKVLTSAEVEERAAFYEATGVELRKITEFNPTRWGVYTDRGLVGGRTRAAALANALRRFRSE